MDLLETERAIYRYALTFLEKDKAELDRLIAGLTARLSGNSNGLAHTSLPDGGFAPAEKKRRTLSQEAKASIAAAQKRRWAAFHAAKEKLAV